MCTENVFTVVYPGGGEEITRRVDRCDKVPRGYRCPNPIVFHHPKTSSTSSSSGAYYDPRVPPTPRLTPQLSPRGSPRPSTPLAYLSASDRESDQSRRSGGSGNGSGGRHHHHHHSRRHHRQRVDAADGTSSGAQYVNVNVNRRSMGPGLPIPGASSGHARRDQERIVIVDGPPTPRTPPQTFSFPSTAPASPRSGYQMAEAHYARSGRDRSRDRDYDRHLDRDRRYDSSLLRPVIVDERPRNRHVHFSPEPSPHRSPSNDDSRRRRRSSYDSRSGSGDNLNPFGGVGGGMTASDDERRRASPSAYADRRSSRRYPIKKEEDKEDQRHSEKKLDLNLEKAERIARLNSQIDSRPAVPLKRSATDGLQQEGGGRHGDTDRELREAVRQLHLGDRSLRRRDTVQGGQEQPRDRSREEQQQRNQRLRRQEAQEAEAEAEAQRRRLEERMMPRRRATVGPGSRRPKIVWENGMYRWE